MIDPKELKLGNIVLNPRGDEGEVISIDREHTWIMVGGKWGDGERWLHESLEGLDLTPEILEKCGFIDPAGNGWGLRLYLDESREIVQYLQDGGLIRYQTRSSGWTTQLPHIKYLHQLQNFFYCLTGQELEVKL